MLRLAFMLAIWGAGAAAGCRDMAFEGASYTICEVTAAQDLRLFHSGPEGALGSFAAVDQVLEPQGLRLDFAMNAGMYHRDLAPVGLYVENGVQTARLWSRGPGRGISGWCRTGCFALATRCG